MLHETYLLKLYSMKFIIPALVFAILGSYFPYIEAMVPVHQSKECLCRREIKYETSKWHFIYNHVDDGSGSSNYFVLNTLNIGTFFLVNFFFLYLNIMQTWKIRHIKDRLDIKTEMTYIVGIWTVASALQYLGFIIT